jgi:predicted MFS family arabinose efflux permease
MPDESNLLRRLTDAATMLVVSLLCFILLIYIAYGSTKRTYEQLLVEKSMAQAELIRTPMETYLRPGLALSQYTGFNQLTVSMIAADRTLISMIVEHLDGDAVFIAGDAKTRTLSGMSEAEDFKGIATLRKSTGVMQLILPLKNKFERVGTLSVTMNRTEIDDKLAAEFRGALIVSIFASIAFALTVFFSSADSIYRGRRKVAAGFTIAFLVVALGVVSAMIAVFTHGAESKGRALADSLGQRLDDIPQIGLQFDQVIGLEDVLESYRRLNPEISAVGITINGRVAVHTDRTKIGAPWFSDTKFAEYRAKLTAENHPRAALVIVSVPKSFVVWQVARHIKNYAALFVASALVASLFLQLAQVMRSAQGEARTARQDWRTRFSLDLVKPAFFLAVFLDHLSYAFLPQFVSAIVEKGGDTSSSAAWPFTAYYLCFALALLPAGRYEQKVGPRTMLVGSLALISISLMTMTIANSLAMVVACRAATGIGQGVLFISIQSYVIANSHRHERTKANGIIVFGYQGGMISGMAIGSLLVSETGPAGVFLLAGLIAALLIVYALSLLPNDTAVPAPSNVSGNSGQIVWKQLASMLKDFQFMQIILLIGIPTKAVLTGVILFAMPLILSANGFAQEDIGQITMIYAACVIISSMVASHLADRRGSCRNLLVKGAVFTALGLLIIAASGHDIVASSAQAKFVQTLLIVLGAAIIGWGHGFINAPVVTHITDTRIASQIGASQTAAAYRVLERFGHMLGPIVMGQLFASMGASPLVLVWVGIFIGLMGALFYLVNPAETAVRRNEEFA